MNLLKKQRINSQENFSKFMSKVSSNQDKWLNNVDSILRLHDKFLSEIKNDASKGNEFYKKIDSIVHEWEKIRQDQNIIHTQENLVSNLYECCLEYAEDYRAQEILPHTIHAKYAHDNIVNAHEIYSDHFANDAKQAADSKNKIEEALNKLDSKKLFGPSINKILLSVIITYTLPIIVIFIYTFF